MFQGVSACFEGFLPQKVQELASLLTKNGGTASDMLTLRTSHLIVNTKRQKGFQESRCDSGGHQVWILHPEFITGSLNAGLQLPEFQYIVKRTGSQQELEAPLETQETLLVNTDSETSTISEDNIEILSELDISAVEGGQVWGGEIGISSSIQYFLGGARGPQQSSKTKNTSINNKKQSKKREGRKKKCSALPVKTLHRLQANNLPKTFKDNQIEVERKENRSDEELFISLAPWGQNTLMVSQEGVLWNKIGTSLPYIMKHQPKEMIHSVVSGKSHALCLTVTGQVYSWGSSHAGQLGHGNNKVEKHPKKIQRVLGNMAVVQISAAGDSSAALTHLGGVYMWGKNRDGKLGSRPNHVKQTAFPMLVHFPDDFEVNAGSITHVLCGETHSMALTELGVLYSWGSNRYGQLGRFTRESYSFQPTPVVNIPRPITSADCGLFYSAAVCDGKVYRWGLGRKEEQTDNISPKLISFFQQESIRISSVSCGDYVSLCLQEGNGQVYLVGDNKNSENISTSSVPILIPQLQAVTHVYCNKFRFGFLINEMKVLLQRHAIEGNVEPLTAILQYMKKKGIVTHIKTEKGESLLHLACLNKQSAIVRFLVFTYPELEPNMIDTCTNTPLHICAKHNFVECASVLLLHPNINIDQPGQKGNTALHMAIIHRNKEMMNLLVYHGADKIARNVDGNTVLHVAVKIDLSFAKFLVCNAASIVEKDENHMEPLEYLEHWDDRIHLRELAETNEVFISYAHVDQPFALRIRKRLNRFSLRCWMDDWRLKAGDDWRTSVGKGVFGASVIVFIATNNSVISDWCLKELYLAVELNKKILIVEQDDISDHKPLLDVQLSSLLFHSKSKDLFDFKDCVTSNGKDFDDVLEALARRIYGLLEYQGPVASQHTSTSVEQKITTRVSRKLLSKRSLYVCYGFGKADTSFVGWIQTKLKEHSIHSVMDPITECKDLDEKMVVSHCWAYILVVSPSVLDSPVIQQHLKWIEQTNGRVHLILLYFDADRDYMTLFPNKLFSTEQIQKLSELFSFCIHDAPWLHQLMYTLNLLRKQTLLDRHIDRLLKRIEEIQQQTNQLDAELDTSVNLSANVSKIQTKA